MLVLTGGGLTLRVKIGSAPLLVLASKVHLAVPLVKFTPAREKLGQAKHAQAASAAKALRRLDRTIISEPPESLGLPKLECQDPRNKVEGTNS